MQDHDHPQEPMQEGRGRSEKKRQAKAVEQLAQRLAELGDTQFAALPKSAELTGEIEQARATRGHSSRKRQIKHLAGVLRRHEARREELEAFLDGVATTQRQEAMAFQHLEQLRDRLCDAKTFEAASTEIRSLYPHLDHDRLGRLAGSVHDYNDKRAAREIFRRLREAAEQETSSNGDGA